MSTVHKSTNEDSGHPGEKAHTMPMHVHEFGICCAQIDQAVDCAIQNLASVVEKLDSAVKKMERMEERLEMAVEKLAIEKKTIDLRKRQIEEQRQRHKEEKHFVDMQNAKGESLIRLNVGGHFVDTSRHTLCESLPDSMIAAWFSGRHTLHTDEGGRVLVDRDYRYFQHVLDFCRRGGHVRPTLPGTPEEVARVREEFDFFCLPWEAGGSSLVEHLAAFGQKRSSLIGHTSAVNALDMNHRYIVSGEIDRSKIIIWDRVTGEPTKTIRFGNKSNSILPRPTTSSQAQSDPPKRGVQALAMGDSSVIAWGDRENLIYVWDVVEEKMLARFPTGGSICAVGVAGEHTVVVLGQAANGVLMYTGWDVAACAKGPPTPLWHVHGGYRYCGRIAIHNNQFVGVQGGQVKAWDVRTGQCVRNYVCNVGTWMAQAAVLGGTKGGNFENSPNSHRDIVVGYGRTELGRVCVAWERETGMELFKCPIVSQEPFWALDDRVFFILGDNGSRKATNRRPAIFQALDIASGKTVTLEGVGSENVTVVAVGPSGLAAGLNDGTISVWEPKDGYCWAHPDTACEDSAPAG